MVGKKKSGKRPPNLKRTGSGTLINQYGVKFTEQEKKALENAVNKVHYKRKKMLKEAATLPRVVMGKPTGDTVGSLQLMGKESDFILTKKTKSLQRFQSKADYNRYMKYLERANSKDYVDEKTRLYKRNYIHSLKVVFGEDVAKDVIKKVRYMRLDKFRKMVEQDELLEIGFIDSKQPQNPEKLNQIREAFGMEHKDEFYDGDGDEDY